MRLLNTDTLQLETSFGTAPEYAILSHRWQKQEVTFQDVKSGCYRILKGWSKIQRCCSLARSRGLRYAWVDTCCIDKTSSAELSESINSMFNWYKQAKECYAFLSDVHSDDTDSSEGTAGFIDSAWFTRGWTLQELIAPSRVLFYNSRWKRLGCRETLCSTIASITKIDSRVLEGTKKPLDCTVAQRMAWAARRETTRIEDRAYSLLGLLGVNMPMLYGEGEDAFRRLQQEIIRQSDDHTIFAWSDSRPVKSIFAPSPNCFEASGFLERILPTNDMSSGFHFANAGLSIELLLLPLGMNVYLAPLRCGRYRNGNGDARKSFRGYSRVCLFLQRTEHDLQYIRVRVSGKDFAIIEGDDIAWVRDMLQCKEQRLIIRHNINIPVEAMFYGFLFEFNHGRMFSRGHTPRPEDVLCVHKWKPHDPVFEIDSGALQTAGVFRLSGFSSDLYMYLGFDTSFSPLCIVTSQTPNRKLSEMSNLGRVSVQEARQVLDLPWLLCQINSPNHQGTIINFRGDRQIETTIQCKSLSLRIKFEFRKSERLGMKVWHVSFSRFRPRSGGVSPIHSDMTVTKRLRRSTMPRPDIFPDHVS